MPVDAAAALEHDRPCDAGKREGEEGGRHRRVNRQSGEGGKRRNQQNAAYAEEMTYWPIQPGWNNFVVDTTHPYFVLDNNRCILCRRCVRAATTCRR